MQKARKGMSGNSSYSVLKQEMYRATIDYLESTSEESIRMSAQNLQRVCLLMASSILRKLLTSAVIFQTALCLTQTAQACDNLCRSETFADLSLLCLQAREKQEREEKVAAWEQTRAKLWVFACASNRHLCLPITLEWLMLTRMQIMRLPLRFKLFVHFNAKRGTI